MKAIHDISLPIRILISGFVLIYRCIEDRDICGESTCNIPVLWAEYYSCVGPMTRCQRFNKLLMSQNINQRTDDHRRPFTKQRFIRSGIGQHQKGALEHMHRKSNEDDNQGSVHYNSPSLKSSTQGITESTSFHAKFVAGNELWIGITELNEAS